MSYNSDFQELLLMQESPKTIKNQSAQSSSCENIQLSQPNDFSSIHSQNNQHLLLTCQIQEHSKKQNLQQNQINFNETLISKNEIKQKQASALNSAIDIQLKQFKNTTSQKIHFKINKKIKQPESQINAMGSYQQQHSAKKGPFVIACQRDIKNQHLVKQPKKQKKAEKKVDQHLHKQEQALDKEFISRTTSKFDQFFNKCKAHNDQFTCIQGHRAKNVCFSKECTQVAFVCDVDDCLFNKNHENCILKLDVQMFAAQLNKNLKRQRDVSLQLFLFEQQIIEKIYENRRKQTKLLAFQGMNCEQIIKCFDSKDKTDLNLKSSHILAMIDDFHKEKQYDLDRLQSLKKQLAEKRKTVKNLLQSTLKVVLKKFNNEELISIPTKLVLNKPEIKFVLQQLNYPKELKLLYRASEHEFNIAKYHNICDNSEHTLTIIKTQHQKYIGAYTPLKLSNKIGRDKTKKSFLMAINLQEKLEHIHSGQCAIYYNKQLGPCFGGLYEQRDIEVYQQNGVLFCKTNFPNAYNWKRHFFSSQDSWRFLTGVTQGKVCRVMDFEVFQVKFRK